MDVGAKCCRRLNAGSTRDLLGIARSYVLLGVLTLTCAASGFTMVQLWPGEDPQSAGLFRWGGGLDASLLLLSGAGVSADGHLLLFGALAGLLGGAVEGLLTLRLQASHRQKARRLLSQLELAESDARRAEVRTQSRELAAAEPSYETFSMLLKLPVGAVLGFVFAIFIRQAIVSGGAPSVNPYGLAFAALAAGLFADRAIATLSAVTSSTLPSRGDG